MNEKLNYLEMLKNNVGEEMAEMMSDEITKVMDEQRGIEMEYARLVEQRDQLKGITNKHRLEETKDDIMNIAAELKNSTKKLCRQLQKKPAVESNQQQVRKHKNDLIKTVGSVGEEMEAELVFTTFERNIRDQIEESHKYERLKEEEKKLTTDIEKTTRDYKNMQNEFTREQDENSKEMTELKRQKNEAQVEKDLHIQYLERQLQGAQSCEDRLHKKKETELQKEIDRLRNVLATEREVNNAVEMHLKERVSLLQSQYKNQESKKDSEISRIETERNEIKERKTRANEEIQSIVEMIKVDTEERKKREEEQD